MTRRRPSSGIAVALGALVGSLAAACGGADADPVVGVEAADGLRVVEVRSGLDGPTQIARHPDGRIIVAELNGGEDDGTGRVLAIERSGGGEAEVLRQGLLTPTGVAVLDGDLWVMEQRTLSRMPLDGGPVTTVAEDLPFNGRSETTVTVTPDGTLLYGTTGSLAGGEVREGSGILWELDPGGGPAPLAAGFKNAYGHTVDADGRLWVTEVSDGTFDGEPAPDELVEVTPGVDHGWPSCIGDRTPVAEFGGEADSCADGPGSQALFAPGATPTSVAVAPWDPDLLLVALWLEGRVVAVPTDPAGAPHEPVEVLGGDLRPQHLLTDEDRVLVVDFDGGRILAVTADAAG